VHSVFRNSNTIFPAYLVSCISLSTISISLTLIITSIIIMQYLINKYAYAITQPLFYKRKVQLFERERERERESRIYTRRRSIFVLRTSKGRDSNSKLNPITVYNFRITAGSDCNDSRGLPKLIKVHESEIVWVALSGHRVLRKTNRSSFGYSFFFLH